MDSHYKRPLVIGCKQLQDSAKEPVHERKLWLGKLPQGTRNMVLYIYPSAISKAFGYTWGLDIRSFLRVVISVLSPTALSRD